MLGDKETFARKLVRAVQCLRIFFFVLLASVYLERESAAFCLADAQT